MAKTSPQLVARRKRIKRIRKRLAGTAEKPRMRVFRSNRHIYVQLIDDVSRVTLASASSEGKEFDVSGDKCERAKKVGALIAGKAQEAGVREVVFDRGGNLYHGRVKALSEGAREGGLRF